MKLIAFKVIMLFGMVIFIMGIFVPWIISNDQLPLGIDIALLLFILFLWVIGIDYLSRVIMKCMEKITENNKKD